MLAARGVASAVRLHALPALRGAWPFAVVLAAGVGATVAVGANLSNAFPSEARPFGWPGPASFENGVAMVRPALVLATSLPALLWGATALASHSPSRRLGPFGLAVASHAALAALSILLATAIGAWAASGGDGAAYRGFFVAHLLLAWSFYMLGLLASTLTRRHAVGAAVGLWVFPVAILDNLVQWRLFREAGYTALAAGQFPSWFYVTQALSPIAGYRATLILWRPGFRDWLEHAALDDAALPGWMTATNFALFVLLLWVVVPLLLAAAAWWGRAWWLQRRMAKATQPATSLQTSPAGLASPAACPDDD